jgi:hypothetical protein
VIISHGHLYKEIPEDEYDEKWSNADGGWALLTDQEYGRQALAYQEARDASDDPEEFGRQALAFRQAVEAEQGL